MSNIGKYTPPSKKSGYPTEYTDVISNTQRVQQFAKYLHDFLPILEKEFDILEKNNQAKPNKIFEIKMTALSDIYKAAEPLHEWYVEKAKKTA